MRTFLKERKKIYQTINADYATIKSRLRKIDWESMSNATITEDYPKFVEQLHLATGGCIPNRKSPRKKKNIYMTTDALRLKNRKHIL